MDEDQAQNLIHLRPECGICNGAFVPHKDYFVTLSGSADSTSCAHINATPRLFPHYDLDTEPNSTIAVVDGQNYCLCLPLDAVDCWTSSSETVTLHVDCLDIVRQRSNGQIDTDRLWTLTAWKHAWSVIPDLFITSEAPYSEIIEVSVKADIPLDRLPPELASDVIGQLDDCSVVQRATAMRLASDLVQLGKQADEVKGFGEVWSLPFNRVSSWTRDNAKPPLLLDIEDRRRREGYLRITIDRHGIKQVERLPDRPGIVKTVNPVPREGLDAVYRRDDERFVVVDAEYLFNATIHFCLGRARLDIRDVYVAKMMTRRMWDTPEPPLSFDQFAFKRISMWPRETRLTYGSQFWTVDLDRITGITFFFVSERLMTIHAHTPEQPCANVAPRRQYHSAEDRRNECWIYLPLPPQEEILQMASRNYLYLDTSLLFRLRLAGFVSVGSWPKETDSERTICSQSPRQLVYDLDTSGCVIASVSRQFPRPGSSDSARTTEEPTDLDSATPFPASLVNLPDNEDLHLGFGMHYYSSAPINSTVIRVRVLRDAEQRFCKGLLIDYRNGAQRALGECRVGVDPETVYNSPTAICIQPIKYSSPEGHDDKVSANVFCSCSNHQERGDEGVARYDLRRELTLTCLFGGKELLFKVCEKGGSE